MFIPNKYTRWYYQIVDRAKLRPITGYTESHHIIPKCMGGNDTKDNRVTLTAREHALCHWLLTKMVDGANKGKMFYALRCLTLMKSSVQDRFSKVPTKTIARAREEASAYSSMIQIGHKRSPESIEKQRATMTGRKRDQSFGQKMSVILTGRKHSPDHVEANRNAQRGKKMSDEARQKMSISRLGRTVSAETRRKISASRIGTKRVGNTWIKINAE